MCVYGMLVYMWLQGTVQEVKKDTFNKVDQPVEVNTSKRDEEKHNPLWRFSMRKRRVVNAKSTSFTRADWWFGIWINVIYRFL